MEKQKGLEEHSWLYHLAILGQVITVALVENVHLLNLTQHLRIDLLDFYLRELLNLLFS